MSYESQIDKERLYFTQCNDTLPMKCPECALTKIPRHCKIFRNFPALWRHLNHDHNDITESKMREIIQVLSYLFKGFQWNMFPRWEYSEFSRKTTTSSFIIDGRQPRIDRVEKFKKIAKLLKLQSQFYPLFKPAILRKMIRVAIGPHDPRILEFYFKGITNYSKPDKVHGTYNVTQFCDILGA